MAVRGRAGGLRYTYELSRNERTKPEVLHAAWAAVYFMLGFVMSGTRVLTEGAPFGLAAVAASGAGLNGVCCLAGAAMGYFVTGGVEWGIKYVAACVMVFTIAFVFAETRLYGRAFFLPAAAGVVMAVTGFMGTFVSEASGVPAAAKLCLETVLAFSCCWFFREALGSDTPQTESEETRHGAAVMITIACALASLSRITVLGEISVGRFMAVVVLMACAMKGGVLTGAAAGTALGAAMDMSVGGAPFFTMTYAVSALLSGTLSRHGRLLFVLAFVVSNAAASACSWNAAPGVGPLFETFCASVVFMLLPSSFLNSVGGTLNPVPRGSGEAGLRRHVARHVSNLAEAYGQLYEAVKCGADNSSNDADISKIFDRAADAVCVGCKCKNRCWNTEYQDTLSAMNDATGAMTARGTLELSDLPDWFLRRCEHPDAFIAAVNGELRARALRMQFRDMLAESRMAAWGQYNDAACVLRRISRELCVVNSSDPLAERRLIRYLRSLDIDADTSVYRDSGGRLRAVIESGQLSSLTSSENYLDDLSAVLGVRLCRPLDDRSSAGKLTVIEAEPLAVSVGIAAMKKKGEKVSGDNGTYFKTDAGVLCVILSDGMGCGDEASRESAECVAILEKFLRAGVEPASAMKILNSVMLLKGGDGFGFATVDLMCVNLFTGETCFYKYGAAPSYVMSGKSVRRINGETMAAGVSSGEGAVPDLVRMKLRPGSTALIASDGVMGGGDDAWVKKLMEEEPDDMKNLARAAVSMAGEIYGESDDMTVLAVRLEQRA